MRKRAITRLYLIACLCLLLGAPVAAQTSGEITGVVTDVSGAAVAGATVTVTVQLTSGRFAPARAFSTHRTPAIRASTWRVTWQDAAVTSPRRI